MSYRIKQQQNRANVDTHKIQSQTYALCIQRCIPNYIKPKLLIIFNLIKLEIKTFQRVDKNTDTIQLIYLLLLTDFRTFQFNPCMFFLM